jgi:DNA-binding transcriptional ArsR family regulator
MTITPFGPASKLKSESPKSGADVQGARAIAATRPFPAVNSSDRPVADSIKKERTYIIPLSNGILARHHRENIGAAIWLFLWMIDKSTKERPAQDGDGLEGLVLGGKPITVSYIAEQTGESQRSVHFHLACLKDHGYIVSIPHRGGASGYAIRKSKKFHRGRAVVPSHEEDVSDREPLQEPAELEVTPLLKVAGGAAKISEGFCNNFRRNKEDKTRTIQGQDIKPLRSKKQGADVDPRRAVFIEDFQKFHNHRNPGVTFHFDAKDGINLDRWLKENSDINREQWQQILRNRSKSPSKDEPSGIDHAAPLWTWVGRARQYLTGPKDRFWNPVNRKGGNHAQSRTATITENLSAALEQRRVRRMAGAAAGDRTGGIPEPATDNGSEPPVLDGTGSRVQ